ncbi:hypothetical protein ACJX0J_020018, partial [Zea mays]
TTLGVKNRKNIGWTISESLEQKAFIEMMGFAAVWIHEDLHLLLPLASFKPHLKYCHAVPFFHFTMFQSPIMHPWYCAVIKVNVRDYSSILMTFVVFTRRLLLFSGVSGATTIAHFKMTHT